MKLRLKLFLSAVFCVAYYFVSCTRDDSTNAEPMLVVKFKFDTNQVRLNNLGVPSNLLAGHAAQSPNFNSISAHYLELSQTSTTLLGSGAILYHAPETTLGGLNAINFSASKIVSENEIFLKIPLKNITAGSYKYARVSLSYQNFDINILHNGTDYNGTLSSFVGFNTYITSHAIGNNFYEINANRSQGYWAFALNGFPYSTSGQAPAGATTVPNPLAQTSPIPSGSCVVTGKFANDLVITGSENSDVVLTLSLSINNSFEWTEVNVDGKFEPAIGETVVDMGLRGLIPSI